MKASFFYATPKPHDDCRMMILGLFTLRETNWLDIGIGLYFLEIGIHIFYGEGEDDR